jgi:hypothetical protein
LKPDKQPEDVSDQHDTDDQERRGITWHDPRRDASYAVYNKKEARPRIQETILMLDPSATPMPINVVHGAHS